MREKWRGKHWSKGILKKLYPSPLASSHLPLQHFPVMPQTTTIGSSPKALKKKNERGKGENQHGEQKREEVTKYPFLKKIRKICQNCYTNFVVGTWDE